MAVKNFIKTTVITPGYSQDPVVYRIDVGKRYFIWKGKNLDQSLTWLPDDLSNKILNGAKQNDLLYELVNYMRRFRAHELTVSVLLQTSDPNELIEFERLQLEQAEKDPNCLNTVFVPHVPKWLGPNENKAITATISKPTIISPKKELKSPERIVEPKKAPEKPIQPLPKKVLGNDDFDFGIDDIKDLFKKP